MYPIFLDNQFKGEVKGEGSKGKGKKGNGKKGEGKKRGTQPRECGGGLQ